MLYNVFVKLYKTEGYFMNLKNILVGIEGIKAKGDIIDHMERKA